MKDFVNITDYELEVTKQTQKSHLVLMIIVAGIFVYALCRKTMKKKINLIYKYSDKI